MILRLKRKGKGYLPITVHRYIYFLIVKMRNVFTYKITYACTYKDIRRPMLILVYA